MGIKQLSLGRTDITDLDPRILNADPKGVGKAITDAANAYDNVFAAKV
jgi:hypothetical protein